MSPTPTTTTDDRRLLRDQVAAATQLADTFLLCRLVGHAWNRIIPDRAPAFGRIVVWECTRCTTKRDDILQPNDGTLLARTYRYVDGYRIKARRKGGRALSTPALRIALLRRDDTADAIHNGAT